MPVTSLLAAPDPDEARALLDGFAQHGIAAQPVAVGSLACHRLPSLGLLLAVGGNGKAQYGVQTQYLLDRCPGIDLLLCAGAAGSLSDSVRVGEVVVATTTVEHDYRNRFNPRPLPRHDGNSRHLERFRQAADRLDRKVRVHFGPVASGDEDIVDTARAAELRTATGALCVAWEGSGGARAARLSGVGFCELRGITDRADGHAARDFHSNLGVVMAKVVQLLLAWHDCGSPSVTIRSETSGDVAGVRFVNESAFGQPAEADLVDRLRAAGGESLSLVAEVDGVVGHILFTPVVVEASEHRVAGMGLAPMAVLPDYQRQGIGSQLVRRGLEILEARGCPFVVVVGHPEYYPRFGFEPAARHGLTSQWEGVPDAAFMVRVIDAPTMSGVAGVARYRPEFSDDAG